jgi:basic amino acid/polyamine antiporter, APA family
VVDPGVTAALAVGLSRYAVVLWPASAGMERGLAVGLVWILALLNMAGLRPSSRALNALTLVKVLAFAAVAAAALAADVGSWTHFTPFFARRADVPALPEAIALGLVSVFFSFGGFWEASRVAGEMRSPGATLPRALAVGVAAITLLYVTITVAFLYLVPVEQVTSSADFARRAGEAMLGGAGPPAFAAIVILSATASAAALLLMAPRVYVAMGRDGLFPVALAKLHPVTQAPIRATALLAAMASVLILSGGFSQILAFFMPATLLFVALSASALFVVRRREKVAPPFRAPGHPVVPALFVFLVAVVVVTVAVARPIPALSGFALVLAGMPVYGELAARGAIGRPEGGGRPS